MCGINLIIDKKKTLTPDTISIMSATTHHRGPDETKHQVLHFNSKICYLGANRLKITDHTDAASQPFISENLKHSLLFNGEIYNYCNLKNDLIQHGVSFTTHSDTEVLFHWLKHYGKEGIKKLEGMFAFIFIDLERQEILLARDRFGIKPIYYFEDNNFFIASSEIKAIFSTGLVKKTVRPNQIDHYLSYKYANPPETFFKNIFELTPGSIMHNKSNTWEIVPFLNDHPSKVDSTPDIEKIESLITNSLLQQLDAKVPLGLLLSGGIDSTLLLALATKEGFQLPTYSIVNRDKDRSFGTQDYTYSRLAASTYGSIHHEIEINSSILDQFESFIDELDQPIGDSAYFLTSEVCKNASKSMKILLSGAGADEFFAGYNRHKAFYTYLNHKKLFDISIPFAKPLINSLPSGIPFPYRKKIQLLKKLINSHDRSPEKIYNNYITFEQFRIDQRAFDQTSSVSNWFEWALKHDQQNYLVSDVLALSDKAAMLHGIELRVPFLEENLAHYLSGLPSEALITKGQKWILKNILSKNGGGKFINRPKEGFGLPLSHWLFNKKVARLWELFELNESLIYTYIDKTIVDHLIDQQKRKVEDHGPLLWSLLVLGHWLQRNVS